MSAKMFKKTDEQKKSHDFVEMGDVSEETKGG